MVLCRLLGCKPSPQSCPTCGTGTVRIDDECLPVTSDAVRTVAYGKFPDADTVPFNRKGEPALEPGMSQLECLSVAIEHNFAAFGVTRDVHDDEAQRNTCWRYVSPDMDALEQWSAQSKLCSKDDGTCLDRTQEPYISVVLQDR